jgi:hypothetical protein
VCAVGFELAAQVGHVHPQVVALAAVARAPTRPATAGAG